MCQGLFLRSMHIFAADKKKSKTFPFVFVKVFCAHNTQTLYLLYFSFVYFGLSFKS